MLHLNRLSKTAALVALPLAAGLYWLLAHAAIASQIGRASCRERVSPYV